MRVSFGSKLRGWSFCNHICIYSTQKGLTVSWVRQVLLETLVVIYISASKRIRYTGKLIRTSDLKIIYIYINKNLFKNNLLEIKWYIKVVFLLVSWGWVRLSPLDTLAINWPILTASDDR
jgi:hypothetical protein